MKAHVYSVHKYMLAIYVNCLLNVSHSRHACRTRNNMDEVRRYTAFSPANPQAASYTFRLLEAGLMHHKM